MRRRMAAVAVGMVLLVTAGCAPAAEPAEPEGDALYAVGAERYDAFATGLHDVLMAVHDDVWTVRQHDHGAAPITCPGGEGFSFHALRQATPADADADGLQQRAVQEMERQELDVTTEVFGSGADEERSIVGTGGVFDRLTVTIRPASGTVSVTASSTCSEGSAHDLALLVFDGSAAMDLWRLLPATEGPDSVPRFFFPADGPVFYDEGGSPIEPQPVVTEVPVAPYGR